MKNNLFSKNKIILISVIFVIVIVISILLNNNIFIEEIDTAPTTEDLNVIYSEVIERNRIMLENPVEYGDKYCSGYVSTKDDLELHEDILNKLKLLSDEICSTAATDYDKVEAIAYYVAENIYYNQVAADDSVTAETISLENVLGTKTATCAGYSNLFSALCNMQDIYCVNLRGGTFSEYIMSDHLMNAPINHEWNAVLIDNEWIFVDTTWLSNNKYTENGYEKASDFDEPYLVMSLEKMSYEHRIDIVDYRNFKTSVNALK